MSTDSAQASYLMLTQAGISAETRARFASQRVTTMRELAFTSKGKGGEIAGKDFGESVLRPLASAVEGPDAIAVRRNYLESWTKVVHELRQSVEPSHSSANMMPGSEITTRLLKLDCRVYKLRMTGNPRAN
eukprot:4432866-Amphidinium_carterae.2